MNRAERYFVWIVCGTAAALAIGWIAFQIQQEGVAPAVLFPLLVGAALGGAAAALARWANLPNARVVAAGAVCWGLLAVVAQDYIGHRERLRLYHQELQSQAPLAAAVAGEDEAEMRPTFWGHLAETGRRRPGWWAADFALTAAAAGIVAGLATRRAGGTRETRQV